MPFISIFNDILGPVMRGPSSSHTAGSYQIAKIVRCMISDEISSADFTFHPDGSYAPTYKALGVDLAFAAGLSGMPLTDNKFFEVFDLAEERGVRINFNIKAFPEAGHPNTAFIEVRSRSNSRLKVIAESTGGGGINIKQISDWHVSINGMNYELLIESQTGFEEDILEVINPGFSDKLTRKQADKKILLHIKDIEKIPSHIITKIKDIDDSISVWPIEPVFFVQTGEELFQSAEEMVKISKEFQNSLAQSAIKYETQVLGLTEDEVLTEMSARLEIMQRSVEQGLQEENINMELTRPSAKKIFEMESNGRLAIGGMHTRAAARAMAAMHTDNSMGIVCAAPTGGSAGVLPGVITTLLEEYQIDIQTGARLLFAASAVGLIIAKRATFSAELAGCQVEIGAAGAMAAAAVVEYAGGSAQQAADAAAIALQNSMGSVCDPVHGGCEIPCHTRNAAAASNAFVCADLILGGYHNPIPLDETIDAVLAVGKTMPIELRCTARGGIAITPSALKLKSLK